MIVITFWLPQQTAMERIPSITSIENSLTRFGVKKLISMMHLKEKGQDGNRLILLLPHGIYAL